MSRVSQSGPTLVTVVDNGPSERRFDVLIIAARYAGAELPIFADRVDRFCQKLFRTEPFDLLGGLVNVHRLDRAAAGPSPTDLDVLDAHFPGPPGSRLLLADPEAAIRLADQYLPAHDMVFVQPNVENYGGSGGQIAVFSAHPDSIEIALHEMGHTAFGLGDEYSYPPTDDPIAEQGHPERHPGPEPDFVNLTVNTDWSSLKWRSLVPDGSPLPSEPSVGDASVGNPSAGDASVGELIGAFEGGDYHALGVFRPALDCRMRTLGQPFCAVCRQQIRRVLLSKVAGQRNL